MNHDNKNTKLIELARANKEGTDQKKKEGAKKEAREDGRRA